MPLSTGALTVLFTARQRSNSNGLIFPSPTGRTLSNATMSKLCKKNNVGCVPHGMRSSFRDWCGETGVRREVAERALGHEIRNAVEKAYARTDLLERRRQLKAKLSNPGKRGGKAFFVLPSRGFARLMPGAFPSGRYPKRWAIVSSRDPVRWFR